jgi:hypothetical protein
LTQYFEDYLQNKPLDRKFEGLKKLGRLPFHNVFLKVIVGEEPPPLHVQAAMLFGGRKGLVNGFAPAINLNLGEIRTTIPQLWGIGQYQESHYGSMSGTKSLEDFVREAIIFSTKNPKIPPRVTDSIIKYLGCLQTPKSPRAVPPVQSARGKTVFNRFCIQCHSNPDGTNPNALNPDLFNVPPDVLSALQQQTAPDIQSRRTLRAFEKAGIKRFETFGLKVRRLNGAWSRESLGLLGSAFGLDAWLCLNGDRPGINHREFCEAIDFNSRLDLRAYLETL